MQTPRSVDKDVAEQLKPLAERLIQRHLRVSLPDDDIRAQMQARLEKAELDTRTRCIAVIGAGASESLMVRANALADDLEAEFPHHADARKAEIARLQRLYNVPVDFETRLTALSHWPDAAARVRSRIAERYSVRHPTILAYEMLAHMLNHRLLDAILTFNFDELLDQSIHDELGDGEYRRLVSDRDCMSVDVDPDVQGYLPLYIKLHGTATEPDSLRFTREAYYELPPRLMEISQQLLDCDRCVVVNVGCGMTGFDLHRLLRIPRQLEVYDLSYEPLKPEIEAGIIQERTQDDPVRDDSFVPTVKRDAPIMVNLGRLRATRTCDEWLGDLVATVETLTGQDGEQTQSKGKTSESTEFSASVRFRFSLRHHVVCDLLNDHSDVGRWISTPANDGGAYSTYLRDRAIIEMTCAVVKARGLAQVAWLATDRAGNYYDLYRREANGQHEPWWQLLLKAGLQENRSLPDVVELQDALLNASDTRKSKGGENDKPDLWRLRLCNPERLATYVLSRIQRDDPANVAAFADSLARLQDASELEIRVADDRICSRAFREPLILPTSTARSILEHDMLLSGRPDSSRKMRGNKGTAAPLSKNAELFITTETGERLLKPPMKKILQEYSSVHVLLAFPELEDELEKAFRGGTGKSFDVSSMGPWRHSRHMTVVCRDGEPWRAMYYARRLRTPVVTPVYLRNPDDAARVLGMFDLYEVQSPDRTLPDGSES